MRKIGKVVLRVFLALFMAAVAYITYGVVSMMNLRRSMHNAVASGLKDPSSAQFRSEVLSENGRCMRGEINGKTAFGGYAGFTDYVVTDLGQYVVKPNEPDQKIEAAYQQVYNSVYCKGHGAGRTDWDPSKPIAARE